MGDRRVVSDTGPLISLEKLPDGYRFIRRHYDQIIIPSAVLDELVQGHFASAESYIAHYGIGDLIVVVDVEEEVEIAELESLDDGEKAAIRLALTHRLPLLIEEEAGRRVARQLGLNISGIAGMVLAVFNNNLITDVEASPKLRILLEAGRINKGIYDGLLEAVQRKA